MGVADHEIDEDDDCAWCEAHQHVYMRNYVCTGCASDEADLRYQDKLDEREAQP
jgi:hypothetical protein